MKSRKLFRAFFWRSIFTLVLLLNVFAGFGQAQDALKYFKNYFVTGDYVVGGVGVRGKGVLTKITPTATPDYYATGEILIGDATKPNGSPAVPLDNTDAIAAFLYWQSDEPNTALKPMSAIASFDGHTIVGDVVGSPQNPACDGTPQSWYGRTYRADVLRYLFDTTKKGWALNGKHTVMLRDGGTSGSGPFSNGASLMIVYRTVVPGNPQAVPYRAVVIYDGNYTIDKSTGKLDQTLGGFYQAIQNSGNTKMTPIVGNGLPSYVQTLNVTSSFGPGAFSKPFVGAAGPRWDNPTFNIGLKANDSSYGFHLTFATGVCLTWSALATSMPVLDTDRDGLVDFWETKGMHLNPGDATHPATFGGCADYPSEACVNLPAMGANPTKPDIYVEMDWLRAPDHDHKPKIASLNMTGDTFAARGYALHYDVGNNYQDNNYNGKPSPYIIRATYAQGGEVIPESDLLCETINNNIARHLVSGSLLGQALTQQGKSLTCSFTEPYPVLSYKRGFRMVKDGYPLADILPHFANIRKDVFRYALWAHALATPERDAFGHALSVSAVADKLGADMMFTFGLWRSDTPADDQVGGLLPQAGTMMHEMGHTLGLGHAGLGRTPPCMPNYFSQMNYMYQVRGLTDFEGKEHIDFSNGVMKPLDEANLSENPTSLGTLPYRIRFFDTVRFRGEEPSKARCDGAAPTSPYIRVEMPSVSVLDWNRNKKVDAQQPFLDINYDGHVPPTAGAELFMDSNDWANVNLQQISARLNANGLSSNVGSLDIGSLDIGSLDIGSLDIGSLDIGSLDIGSLDIGSLDIGSLDIGSLDIGSLDIGSLDIGSLDFGEIDFRTVLASLDPNNSSHPLHAANTINAVALDWGAPTLGRIDHYELYRYDGAHLTPILLASVPGASALTYDDGEKKIVYNDTVNDFEHAGAACPNAATCYNTFYTYYLIAVSVNNGETFKSSISNEDSKEVTHVFILADPKTAVYGDAAPATSQQAFGHIVGTLPAIGCQYAPFRNVGSYAITCSGAAVTSDPKTGVTYVPDTNTAHYDDGTDHQPGRLSITQRPITQEAVANRKTYDGDTTAATLPIMSAGNLAYADKANFIESYDNENAGLGKILTPSGTVVDGTTAVDLTFNYNVTFVPRNNGTIDPRPVTITATADPQTKLYGDPDPPLTYQITNGSLVTSHGDAFTGALTRVPGEAVGQYDILQGTLALSPNYALTFVGAKLTINPRPVTVTADAKTKVYGETDPPLTYQITVGQLYFSDAFTGALTRDAGENVGTYAIRQGTLALTTNYTLSYIGANLNITPKPVTASVTSPNRVYDGTNVATTTCSLTGVINNDVVTCSAANATFASKNAGLGKTVTATGITLGGTGAGNYNLTSTTATTTANIAPRPLTVTATTNTKTYDRTAAAAAIPAITSGTLASGDTANFNETYDNANAGTNKTLTPSGAVNDGNAGNNYNVTFTSIATGVINQKQVAAVVTAANKPFDNTTAATITSCTLTGVIAPDAVTCAAASASFSDPNIGTGKTVTATGITLGGAQAANYVLTSTTATTTANITAPLQAQLIVSLNERPTPVAGAGIAGLELNVTNSGGGAADTVAATLTLPAGMSAVSCFAIPAGSSNFVSCPANGTTVTVQLGTIPAGATALVGITASVVAPLNQTSVIANASVSTTSSQSSTINNQSSFVITLNPIAGPPSGSVLSVATHPSNANIVLAGTSGGGIFRTTDGGVSWNPINGFLSGVVVRAIAIHPTNPNIVYVATDNGTWVSLDGGNGWFGLDDGINGGNVFSIAIDPSTDPVTAYAGTNFGIFKTTDGAFTWTPINNGLTTSFIISSIVIDRSDPNNPNTLYAASQGAGVFKSTNGGTTWNAINTNLTTLDVRGLGVAGINIYAATNGGGVFKSVDGGLNWTTVNTGLSTSNLFNAVVIDPTNQQTVYVGSNAGAFKTINGGASWTLQNSGLTNADVLASTNVTALRLGPSGTLFAGTSAGVFRSNDAGTTWNAASTGINAASVLTLTIDPSNPNVVYAGANGDGWYKSIDAGSTWSAANSGLVTAGTGAFAIDPVNTGTLYAGRSGGAGVYKSTNAGQGWGPVNNGALNSTLGGIEDIVIDPTNTSIVYAAGRAGINQTTLQPFTSGIFKTTNAGSNWTLMNTNLTNTDVRALVINPSTPTTVYAGTFGGGVFKSTDGAATWTSMTSGITNLNINVLAIDKSAPNTLYAGTNGGGIFKTVNGGTSWVPMNTGLIGMTVQSIAVHPTNSSIVYAGFSASYGTTGGVFKSTNGGTNWTRSSVGLANTLPCCIGVPNNTSVFSLAIDPVTPATIYAGTFGSGAFKSIDSGATWQPTGAALVPFPSPSSVTATAGTPQSATTNTAYTTALQATVRDASNHLLSGILVTFTAPGSGASATFAGGSLTATVTTNSSGVATAPALTANAIAGSYSVSASVVGVATTASFSLTNNPPPIPSITGITPAFGTVGTTVSATITGINLSGATAVTFSGNGVTATIGTGGTATSLPISINILSDAPTGTRTFTVTTTAGGISLAFTGFTVASVSGTTPPSVGSISPAGGYQGTTSSVTITGANLNGATSVTFSGTGVTAIIAPGGTSTSLPLLVTVASGAIAGTRSFTVTTGAGSVTSSVLTTFTVLSLLPPTIVNILPTAGTPGSTVIVSVTGPNMLGATAINFSGTGVSGAITSTNATSATVSITIPVDAPLGIRTVTVTNAYGTSAAFSGFTVANPTTMAVTWKSRSYFSDTRTGGGFTGAAANLIGGNIFASHGTRATTGALLSVYDIATNTWTHGGASAPDAAFSRSQVGGGTALGKHYVIGGTGPTTSVEEFDPSSTAWTPRASMSVARMALGVASANNKLYAIGGRTGGSAAIPGTIVNTNEVFDPVTNTWTTLAPLPVAVSDDTATVAYNGKVYVFGGLTATGVTSSLQIYDIATNTWSTGAPVPTPKLYAQAGILNNQIVVFGGGAVTQVNATTGFPSFTFLVTTTEIYDPATNTWTIGPAMRQSAYQSAQGVTFNGTQIFSVGASLSTPAAVEVLDSSTDPQPTVSTIFPLSGAQSTVVSATITGTNLNGATSIVFVGSGVTATIGPGGTDNSLPVTITIASNATLGSRNFSVNTPTGTSSLFTGFTITTAPTPASIIATAGTPQSTAVNTVFPTALQATVTDQSNNPISGLSVAFQAPASGAGGTFTGGSVTANATTDASGVATAPTFTANGTGGTYTVTATVAALPSANFILTNLSGIPAITGISPAFGTQGIPVSATITGTNLAGAFDVSFSGTGVSASIVSSTSTSVSINITILANAATGTRTFTVTSPSGTSLAFTGFTVASPSGGTPPTLAAITPAGGYQGTTPSATISGTNLNGAVSVTFSGTGVTATIAPGGTSTSLPLNITVAPDAPPGSRTYTVTTGAGTTTSTLSTFVVMQSQPPVINASVPASATPGSTIGGTIFGVNMLGATTVTFSGTGVSAAVGATGPSSITVTITVAAGEAAGLRTFTVSNAYGTSAAFGGFTVLNPTPLTNLTWKLRSYFSDTRTGTAASLASANLLGNKIYASHGARVSASAFMSVFDIPTNTWTHGGVSAPDAPTARTGVAGATALGKHYSIGGVGPSNVLEEFDPSTNVWSTRASMSVARAGLSAASLNNKIYAIGGRTGSAIGTGTILNTNEVFDPTTNTWTLLSPLSIPVSDSRAVVGFNGKIYVFGGWTTGGVTSALQIFDVATNSWTAGTPTPTPRINAMAGVINGQIAVFGGSAVSQFNAGSPAAILPSLSQTEMYDPVANTWTLGPTMRFAATGTGQGVTFNASQIFAVGGSSIGSSSTQVLDSSTDPQPTITSITPNTAPQGTTLSAVLAGTNLDGATSVVFSSTGVTATIASGGTSTSLPISITIAGNAPITNPLGGGPLVRTISVNTPTGSSNLFTGFTVTAGTSSGSITATSGNGQSTTVNTAFATALQATVRDASNNLVIGATVTFSAPTLGASGTFTGGLTTTSAGTNAFGVATAPTFTANGSTGTYTVTASVSGVITTANFTLTNTSTTPTVLAFYPFDSSGADASGNGFTFDSQNVQFQNGALSVNGIYEFNANGYKAQTPNITSFNYANFTVSADFNADATAASRPILVGGRLFRWIDIDLGSDRELKVSLNNNTLTYGTGQIIQTGKWYNVAASLNLSAGRLQLFLDGQTVLNQTLPSGFQLEIIGTAFENSDKMFTLEDYSNARAYKGLIDNLRVYDRALSSVPAITTMSANQQLLASGTVNVTVTGNAFQAGATVLSSNPSTATVSNVIVASPTSISFNVTPVAVGSTTFHVVNPDGGRATSPTFVVVNSF